MAIHMYFFFYKFIINEDEMKILITKMIINVYICTQVRA